jgi:transposase InsO family protein
VERLNGTKRQRDKVLRGMKKNETPLRAGFDIYYNYIRPHQGLGRRTPAEKASMDLNLNGDKWLDLIKQPKINTL